MNTVTFLAHAGPGHTWQSMVVLASFALMVVLIVAAIGRLPMAKPDDLVMPIAIIAIGSTLAPIASYWLSDAIGVALPVGVTALVALLLATLTPLDVRFPAPLPMGAITLAIVATVLLHQPLAVALHPPPEVLPMADDSQVEIATPDDGDQLAAGEVPVEVRVTDGSIGPGAVPLDQLPSDAEEAGSLAVAVQAVDGDGAPTGTQQRLDVTYDQTCTVDDPCPEVTFTIEVEPGDHRLTVEFTRGDDTPFATPVRDQVTFSAD